MHFTDFNTSIRDMTNDDDYNNDNYNDDSFIVDDNDVLKFFKNILWIYYLK